ncbi:hypothetical protein NGA79_00015 [Lactococcus garvieae]|uniref:Uncharacterized protein n=1 Tax=Lactococcus garvieae TaxID=1363 RepID=A0A6L2ZTR6_9LACT|nr:hypothetical protein [Lactococcus garvieae]MDG6190405.1 hypothetical protein [Lactococcus garvieae]PCS03667.1 hypothetical protein RU85_GL000004 [Lactococcus garvieae]GFO50890.1 hypothetical protein ikelab_01650 [Lactococcus garvieae]
MNQLGKPVKGKIDHEKETKPLFGGIIMLISFAVAPKIAISLLDMAKNNMNKFFYFG